MEQDKNMVHLINKKGERKVISWADYEIMNQSQNESQNANDDKFYIDTEWYLSHGYVTHEQHMRGIKIWTTINK